MNAMKFFSKGIVFFIITALTLISCTRPDENDLSETIINLEKTALDRWGAGDPFGYLDAYADEITYFDPDTPLRKDGLKTMMECLSPLAGEIHIEKYRMINPKVQVHGNSAILTFNLIDYVPGDDGQLKALNWNCTEVYTKIDGSWKIIHSHWSRIKPFEEE